MKKEAIFIFILIVLAFAPFVSATDTDITIKTLANHDVMIGILQPDQVYSLIEAFHENSGGAGEITITFSNPIDVFDVGVWVKKNDELVIRERFEDVSSGDPLTFEVFPEGYVTEEPEEENETQVNETEEAPEENVTEEPVEEVVEETTETEENESVSPGITGFIAEEGGFFSGTNLYYVIAFVLLALIVIIGSAALRKRQRYEGEHKEGPREAIKVRKLSEIKKEEKHKLDEYKKSVEDAEKKIEDAQKEIKKIKNAERIDEIKKKIQEEQDELKKLEGKD